MEYGTRNEPDYFYIDDIAVLPTQAGLGILTAPAMAGNKFTFLVLRARWEQLFAATNLLNWNSLETSSIAAAGSVIITNPSSGDGKHFYRVQF